MSTIDLIDQPSSRGIVLTMLDNMIWPILIVISLAIAVVVPATFKNYQSIELVLHSSVGLGLLVLAEGVCLISGHFDLSIGAIAGFSAMFTGLLLSPTRWGIVASPAVGFLVILTVGTVIGVTNGVMISKLGVNPFLQTLAFLIIFEGLKISLSSLPVSGLPQRYLYPGSTSYVAIGLLVFAFVAMALIMHFTEFGQAIYALGSNKDAARAVGINTDRMIIAVYAISGFLSGAAGLMLTGYTSVVSTDLGQGLVFPAFAAAVIGGISLFGGRGKISGALGGVILLGIIQSALNLSGLQIAEIRAVNGVVLLGAILLYNTRTQLREYILASEV